MRGKIPCIFSDSSLPASKMSFFYFPENPQFLPHSLYFYPAFCQYLFYLEEIFRVLRFDRVAVTAGPSAQSPLAYAKTF
jgi:hypothetical protein